MKFYSNEFNIYIDLDTFYELYDNYHYWCSLKKENLQYTRLEIKQLINEKKVPENFINNLIYYNKLMKKF